MTKVTDENKAITRKLMSVFVNGEISILVECLTSETLIHQYHFPHSVQTIKGMNALRKFVPEVRHAFPDFNVKFEDQVAEGDRVASRVTFSGTHKGKLMDIPPSHRHLIWTGIFIFRFRNKKIVETWGNWDLYAILEQLGIVTSRVSINPFDLGAFPKKVL